MKFTKTYMSSDHKKKVFHFDNCEVGDYVKFRLLKASTQSYYEDDSQFLLPELKEVEAYDSAPTYSDIVSGKILISKNGYSSEISNSKNGYSSEISNSKNGYSSEISNSKSSSVSVSSSITNPSLNVEPLALFKADSIWNTAYVPPPTSSQWDLLGFQSPFSSSVSSTQKEQVLHKPEDQKTRGWETQGKQGNKTQPKQEEKEEKEEFEFSRKRNYSIYYGKVVEVDEENVGVLINEKKNSDFPPGIPIYIDRRCIIQLFNQKLVANISPRLALKNLWKNLIFREVKITKQHLLRHVEYKYLNKYGLERTRRFLTMEEAQTKIAPEYHKNLHPCYTEYYGFTKNKFIRVNDIYNDKEIFFSKKCYCELDFSDNPTGDFILDERGFNHVPPATDALICGIVENGEKGLFFRKWFVCSNEFLTLWTMVCEPQHPTLKENKYVIMTKDNAETLEDKKRKIKDFDVLLKELDTSRYSVNINSYSFPQIPANNDNFSNPQSKKHTTYNLERAAIYYTNRYQQVASAVFHSSNKTPHTFSASMSMEFPEYTEFQKKLIQNLLWVKHVKV